MIKIFKYTKILFFFLFIFSGCSDRDSNVVSGTVKYLSLEGGFYGIITDDKKNLDPTNLPDEFKIDGLRVYIVYEISEGQMSTHMWGTIINIIQINRL